MKKKKFGKVYWTKNNKIGGRGGEKSKKEWKARTVWNNREYRWAQTHGTTLPCYSIVTLALTTVQRHHEKKKHFPSEHTHTRAQANIHTHTHTHTRARACTHAHPPTQPTSSSSGSSAVAPAATSSSAFTAGASVSSAPLNFSAACTQRSNQIITK